MAWSYRGLDRVTFEYEYEYEQYERHCIHDCCMKMKSIYIYVYTIHAYM